MLNYIYNIIYIVLSSQTLTADNYGEHFLSSGTLDLWGKAIWIKSSHNKVPYTFSSFIHKHCLNKSNKRPIGHIAHTYNMYMYVDGFQVGSQTHYAQVTSSGGVADRAPLNTSSTPYSPPGSGVTKPSTSSMAKWRSGPKCPKETGSGQVISCLSF